MKKTLLALTVVASVIVSGSVMAAGEWTDNAPSGSVSLGGTVTVTNPVVWQWKVGVDKTDFSNETLQMTNNKKELAITVNQDIPIVAAKLKNAVAGADFDQPNTFPKVSFTSNGNPVTPVYGSAGNSTMTLQLLNPTDQSSLGTLTANVRAAAAVAIANTNGTYETKGVSGDVGAPLEGAISSNLSNLIWGGESSTNISSKFGAPTLTDIKQQVKDFLGVSDANFSDDLANIWFISRNSDDTKVKAYAYSYGMGIENGKQLQLHFDKPVEQATQWIAPLTVNVSYQ